VTANTNANSSLTAAQSSINQAVASLTSGNISFSTVAAQL